MHTLRVLAPLAAALAVAFPANALAADTTPPTGSILVPEPGAVVSGTEVVLDTDARDTASGTLRVVHYVDNAPVGAATPTVFGFVTWWDSTKVANGSHTLKARITDAAGNAFVTPSRQFVVDNVPTARIAAPRCGGSYTGSTTVSVAATAATTVEVLLDGTSIGMATPSVFGYIATFDASRVAGGTHVITAVAKNGSRRTVSPACRITTIPRGYVNPVFRGDAPDPTVMLAADGYFYAYTTGTRFPVLRSRDLVKWTRLGTAFSGTAPSWVADSWWAPDVSRTGNHYTMLYSGRGRDGRMRIGYATSTSAAGPFRDRGVLIDHGGSWGYVIDANLVQYAPGRYILYYGSTGGSAPRDQTGITAVGVTIASDGSMRAQLPGGVVMRETGDRMLVEGAWVVQRGSTWYLFYSDGEWSASSGANEYQLKVAKGPSALGPFTKRGTPVVRGGSGFGGAGHGSTITDDAGQTWLLYHAWTSDRSIGRVLMLDKVSWTSGWPVVNGNRGPTSTAQPAPVLKIPEAR